MTWARDQPRSKSPARSAKTTRTHSEAGRASSESTCSSPPSTAYYPWLRTPADLIALQRTIGNQATQRLVSEAVQRQGGQGQPPRRDRENLPREVVVAARLREYMVGSRSQRSTRVQKLRLLRRYLHSKPADWLRAVERNYNHAPPHSLYLVLNFAGTPFEYGHWQAEGRRPSRESPFRRDITAALGGSGSTFVEALESATRLTPLSGKEYASAILAPNQRAVALARAKGEHRLLAQWLFSAKTWSHLAGSGAQWSPVNKGGFFELPTDEERINWPKTHADPRTGDHAYLQRIAGNIAAVHRQIDQLRAEMCAGRMAGQLGVGEASLAHQWACGQLILEYRAKLRPLLKTTARGVERAMPLPFVWGPRPENTREMCKTGR